MPTKWLEQRVNGSKYGSGIPSHRAFCGYIMVSLPFSLGEVLREQSGRGGGGRYQLVYFRQCHVRDEYWTLSRRLEKLVPSRPILRPFKMYSKHSDGSAVGTSLCVAPVVAFQRKTDCPSATARMLDGDQSSRFR